MKVIKSATAILEADIGKQVSMMQFASEADGILVVTNAAADLDFPNVEVSGLPSGITIVRVTALVIISALFDTSSAENQMSVADGAIRVKKSTGAWGTDDLSAIDVAQNSLQVDADAYRGGAVLFGSTDIKSEVDGDATYNFRSEETNRGDAIAATGANLELLDVVSVLRFFFTS